MNSFKTKQRALLIHGGILKKSQKKTFSTVSDELLEKGRTTWEWKDRVPIYQEVVKIIREDLPILYLAKSIIPVAYREYVRGFDAGAGTWFGYYGGGLKKVWLDK